VQGSHLEVQSRRRANFNLNYLSHPQVLAPRRWPLHHPPLRRHTRDPRTGKRNIGMYRMQVYDGQTTGMHWQRQKVAAEHYRNALRAAASQSADNPLSAAVSAMAESAGGAVAIPDGPIGGLPQLRWATSKARALKWPWLSGPIPPPPSPPLCRRRPRLRSS
jgi:hypothetical protein